VASRGILINRDYRRLWLGQAVSTVGDNVFNTTLVIWIAKTLFANDPKFGPVAVSGLVLCTVLAVCLIGPIAGVFVDRWSHRRIMLASEAFRFLLVGGLTLVTLVPVHRIAAGAWLAMLYVVVFLVIAAEMFFNPSRFATIGDIVHGEADQARAFGIGQATSATAAIIGPPLAAPLLITVGVQWALLANALSYAVSFVAVRAIRFPAAVAGLGGASESRPSWRAEFVAGLRMFAGNRFLVALALVAFFAQLGTGPVNTLDVYFVRENLHVNQNLLGFLSTAMGAGSVIGGLIAGRVVARISARRTTWLGLTLVGVTLVVLARQTGFPSTLVVIFLMAIPLSALNTAIMPQLLAVTPKEFLGRMNATLMPLIQLSSAVSIAISASLASTVLLHFHPVVAGLHMGRIDTLFTAGGVIIVAAGIYGYFRLPPNVASEAGAPVAVPAQPSPAEPVTVAEPAVIAIEEHGA